MSKSIELLKLLEDNSSSDQSELDRFLDPTKDSNKQDAQIKKFRQTKQLRYMKKFMNDPTDDNKPLGGTNREYYWDATVKRVYGV